MCVYPNNDWSKDAILSLREGSVLNVSFDYDGHNYRRLRYEIKHCEVDWSVSESLFESDYADGFCSDLPIDDCNYSINTNKLYTHCSFEIPNENCRLKLSGNYRIGVYDDNTNDTLFYAYFMVSSNDVSINADVSYDTDIDVRRKHQQLDLSIKYPLSLRVIDPNEQFRVFVIPNHRWDQLVCLPAATYIQPGKLDWKHCRKLIFPAGNEFHKFELLDLHRSSLGMDRVAWNGSSYDGYLNHDYIRKNYVYDEDINGSFILRNSDNYESDITSEYVNVHFYLDCPNKLSGNVYVNGRWAQNGFTDDYLMEYLEEEKCYHVSVPLKYGYYSYQYYVSEENKPNDTEFSYSVVDGDYYQTENEYLVLVYYKDTADRTWKLLGQKSFSTR